MLYMSGYTNDALIERGLFDAQMVLLQKPFALSAFLSAIREVLENDGRDHKSNNPPSVTSADARLPV